MVTWQIHVFFYKITVFWGGLDSSQFWNGLEAEMILTCSQFLATNSHIQIHYNKTMLHSKTLGKGDFEKENWIMMKIENNKIGLS